jgi:hypothetical protein
MKLHGMNLCTPAPEHALPLPTPAMQATPKGILKLMSVEGLTIFHIKSHLQKFRLNVKMPFDGEDPSEGSHQRKKGLRRKHSRSGRGEWRSPALPALLQTQR